MRFYVWVTPAFVKGSPLDHTWVTDYDSRVNRPKDIQAVIKGQWHYWYCFGKFHQYGQSSAYSGGLLGEVPSDNRAFCLVEAEKEGRTGTINRYGVDGVCHQLANQVLYPCGLTVSKARGYRLSSAIYGTYGRRHLEWWDRRVHCNVPIQAAEYRKRYMSLLYSRARYVYGAGDPTPLLLEERQRALLSSIDEIGFSTPLPNETPPARATKLNERITQFVREVEDVVSRVAPERGAAEAVRYLLGVELGEEAAVVDPELFEFPGQ